MKLKGHVSPIEVGISERIAAVEQTAATPGLGRVLENRTRVGMGQAAEVSRTPSHEVEFNLQRPQLKLEARKSTCVLTPMSSSMACI